MSLVNVAAHNDGAFDSIPVIDFTDATSADAHSRRALAHRVREACLTAGFFYVTNHGVPESVISRATAAMRAFFDLPLETKMKLDMRNFDFRGYNPLYSAKNDAKALKPDAHEGFEFGYEDLETTNTENPGKPTNKIPNVWPDKGVLPNFREAMLEYYHAVLELGHNIFPLLALALDIPEDFFSDKTRNSAALLRILHYPSQPPQTDSSEGSLGIGAHTDWEVFTILWQQPGIQALEVCKPNGEWLSAPPLPGSFVVNLGDMLARWTNGVFKSNVHRASNASGAERYSIPLFFGTDYDVRLEPIPTCVSDERPMRHDIITAGEYVRKRAQETYGHHKED